MRPDLLVCPACRAVGDGRIDLRTLERAGDDLVCECGGRFPIVDGVASFAMTHEVETAAASPGSRSAAEPRAATIDDATREHISIYMDAHWARPLPFAAKLAGLARVHRAVELGCSAGRIVHELAQTADHVVGVDLAFATLRRARRLLDGLPADYERRVVGNHYEPARAEPPRAVTNVTLVQADALDPPLVPRAYDRVVALNLIDSVRDPLQLLEVCDALCAPGGELIVSSPYAWQAGITDPAAWLGGADPAAALVDHLRPGYAIADEDELAWTLRRDARCQVTYRVHYLRARKAGPLPAV
ncbi:MAG TPA: methyltransferase [Kofleriaceae bacterium]|jgi:SAM-dependent methyltransferase